MLSKQERELLDALVEHTHTTTKLIDDIVDAIGCCEVNPDSSGATVSRVALEQLRDLTASVEAAYAKLPGALQHA